MADTLDQLSQAHLHRLKLRHEWDQAEGYFASILEAFTADVRNGHYDAKLDDLRPTIDEIRDSAHLPRFAHLIEDLRVAFSEAEDRRRARDAGPSEELVIADDPPPAVLRLKGRLVIGDPVSNEICLPPDLIAALAGGGDD